MQWIILYCAISAANPTVCEEKVVMTANTKTECETMANKLTEEENRLAFCIKEYNI